VTGRSGRLVALGVAGRGAGQFAARTPGILSDAVFPEGFGVGAE